MATIDIKFRNTQMSLESNNVERLAMLVEKLNKRAEVIAEGPGNFTDTKLAIISALMLEDQVDTLTNKLSSDTSNSNDQVEQTKTAFTDTVNYLADYIEDLADRIEKDYNKR